MTNSEQNLSSEKLLDTIMDLLNEERMAREIDERIDLAVETFQVNVKVPLSHSDFNRLISGFVRRIYQKGLRLPRHLSEKEHSLTELSKILDMILTLQ